MKLDLLVLRTSKLDDMRVFYSALGARFQSEQHGNGPQHYAATLSDGLVLELYPALDEVISDSGLRLGLKVEDVAETLRSLGQNIMPSQTEWGLRALVHDPDGRTIELLQKQAAATSARA